MFFMIMWVKISTESDFFLIILLDFQKFSKSVYLYLGLYSCHSFNFNFKINQLTSEISKICRRVIICLLDNPYNCIT